MKIQLKWNESKMNELSHRLEKVIFQRQESGILHNSFLWSEGIFEAVCSGDELKVRTLLEQEIYLEGEVGELARDQLRSFKNLLICSVANFTYRIIWEQILDPEMAYSISDACIQMVEDSKFENELLEAAAAFCLTFCRYVHKKTSDYHPLVRQSKEYVFKHFHEKIVIEDMAKRLAVSSTYLGIIFKQSEGMTLHQFIIKEKLQRAKNLLRYSDYDLGTISLYLGFASQSHFGREFKKHTGYTPASYRSKNNRLYRDNL